MTKELVNEAATSRNIMVVQTQGGTVEFTTDAKTLGELKDVVDLDGLDVNFDNMKIVNGENQHIYELDDTILPSGNFTLFLMPIKNKSGAYVWDNLGFFPLRNYIKTVINAYGEEAEIHFNTGQKWSKENTDALRTKLLAWEYKVAAGQKPNVKGGLLVDDLVQELNRGINSGNLEVAKYAKSVADSFGLEVDDIDLEEEIIRDKFEEIRRKFHDVEQDY